MDFRNADGSIGATCGNGLRVFSRYLVEANLEGRGTFKIGTHAGTVTVTIEADDKDFDRVAVEMGKVIPSLETDLTVTTESGSWSGVGIGGMNNHCVTVVSDIADAGTLQNIPTVTPAGTYPDGVNVEFIAPKSPTHIAMRTHERGVGETLSCGSGSCAAAYVWADSQGLIGEPWSVQVDVLGGTVFVSGASDGTLTMRGPAEFVAQGVIEPHLWQI
jgi:diaminopimelate epimerase